jgi:hypothetical protein
MSVEHSPQAESNQENELVRLRDEFLTQMEMKRSSEEEEAITAIRARASSIYQRLSGTQLEDPRIIVSIGEARMLRQLVENKMRGDQETTLVIPDTLEASSITEKLRDRHTNTETLFSIGYNPNALEGEIAHELFHAYFEEGFLKSPDTEGIFHKIMAHYENIFAYGKYVSGDTWRTGDEISRLSHFCQPNEIAAHILGGYIDYEDMQKKGVQRARIMGVVQGYSRYGKEGLINDLLTAFERHIREKTRQSDFALPEKEAFVDFLAKPKLSEESTDYQRLRTSLFEELRATIVAGHTREDPETGKRLLETIVKTKTAILATPDALQRLEETHAFFEELDRILSAHQDLRTSLGIDETYELISYFYDNKRGEIYDLPGPAIGSTEELLANFTEAIEQKKKEMASQPKEKKLSFEDFLQNRQLVEEYGGYSSP